MLVFRLLAVTRAAPHSPTHTASVSTAPQSTSASLGLLTQRQPGDMKGGTWGTGVRFYHLGESHSVDPQALPVALPTPGTALGGGEPVRCRPLGPEPWLTLGPRGAPAVLRPGCGHLSQKCSCLVRTKAPKYVPLGYNNPAPSQQGSQAGQRLTPILPHCSGVRVEPAQARP